MKNARGNSLVERYLNQAEKYIKQGEEELKADDLRQAGEKYWGAATQMLKAWATVKC